MAIYFDRKNRLIIPRWRNFDRKKLDIDHLPINSKELIKTDYSKDTFILKKLADWEDEKTLGNAWEIVNAAYILDEFKIAIEAAKFLSQNISQVPSHLKTIILDVLGEPNETLDKIIVHDEDIKSLSRSVGLKIKRTKNKLKRCIRNEFLWIELARLYSIIGHNQKAEKCVLVALQLSDNYNRFILRAASRFFYHLGDFEKAQAIIKRSPLLKVDPILLSAEISYATRQERASKFIKLGFEYVDSKKFPNGVISELSGMLATLELRNGAIKSAKKMTKLSLLAPNDNSLAQAEWIARHLNDVLINPELNNMEFAYEARAFQNLYDYNYNEALHEGIDWIIDQPFSKRAFHFVSYVCVSLTNKFDLAIEACEFGLKSNPNSFPLLNNLSFAYASVNELEKAKKILPKLAAAVNSEREKIFYAANEGYIYYKSKDFSNGKSYYEKAIALADSSKDNKDLKSLAQAYYIREQYLANEIPFDEAKSNLKALIKNERNFDLITPIISIISSIEKKLQLH